MKSKVRYGIERDNGEHIAIFTSEDAAIKRAQRERELDAQAVRDGWCKTVAKYRVVEVTGRIW